MTQPQADYGIIVPPTREENLIVLQERAEDLMVDITGDAQEQLKALQAKYPAGSAPSVDDLSDPQAYKENHAIIQDIKAPRLDLEKSRKEFVGPLNTIVKKINSAAKPLKDGYLELEEPRKQAKKDFDLAKEIKKREAAEAEQVRVTGIADEIARIKALSGSLIRATSDEVAVQQTKLDMLSFAFQEFQDSADDAIKDTTELLSELYEQKEAAENQERKRIAAEKKAKEEQTERESAERKRLAEQKSEQDAAAAKMKEQQCLINAQMQEIAEAKQQLIDAKEAEARAAKEKEEAEALAKRKAEEEKAAEDAEAERQDRIAKAEEERKEREKALFDEWRQETIDDINKVLSWVDDGADYLVDVIIKGDVRHITFSESC